MKRKPLIIVAIFVLLFLGEIAISFSFKKESDRNLPNSEIVPLSHKLANLEIESPETAPIDSLVSKLIKRNSVVGASVAVTHKGKLVYTKGFGYANIEDSIQSSPDNLYRIASVSKLITAITIMKLVEDEKISLSDKVFGKEGILYDSIYADFSDKRIAKITVKNLLEHTAGWNHKKGDPVFNTLYIARKLDVDAPARIEDVISYTLQNKLDWNPGARYCYSNFGYVVLGKIIENVTGMGYEDYVQFAMLHPLGIYDMHIGHSFKSDKFENEVNYYDKSNSYLVWSFDGSKELVPIMYGGNHMEVLGAAGGWVASAPELAKLLSAIDGFSTRPDLLSKKSIKAMTEIKHNDRNLIGWRGTNKHGTWWRTGTFTGSSALLMRNANEVNWVILLNTSTKKQSKIHSDISGTMFSAMGAVKKWPDYDLFNFEPELLQAQNK